MKITRSNTVTDKSTDDMLAAFENKLAEMQVSSSKKVECATDSNSLSVAINDGDDSIFYKDVDGAFGDEGEFYALADIKKYWNDECYNDESLEEFGSFDAWWAATCEDYTMQEVSSLESDFVEDDKEVAISDSDYDTYYEDENGGFGDPGETYSLGEIKTYWNENNEGDPALAQYSSFSDWWKDTYTNYLREI